MKSALEMIEGGLRAELDRADQAREQVLPACRDIVRMASEVIKEVHRHHWQKAKDGLSRMADRLAEVRAVLADHPALRFAGFVTSAEKEYAEAAITCAVLSENRLPTPAELAVAAPEYLNGMAEAIGEMRRHLLDRLRKRDFTEAERLLRVMDDFYHFLFALDYPDALLRGLRRQVDADRAIIERTRSDLTTTLIQENLRAELLRLEEKLARP